MSVNYVHAPRVARPLGGAPVDDLGGWQQTETGLVVPPAPPAKGKRSGLPIAIGLFSGAGGFDLGVHQAGFHVVASSDNWPVAALTYLTNLGTYPGLDLRFVEESDRAGFERALNKAYGVKDGELPADASFRAGSGWLSSTRDHEPGSCASHVDDDEGRRWFCDTYHAPPAHRYGCDLYWLGDVRELSGSDFLEPLGLEPGDVDFIVGGPPCQGFSHAGQRQVMDPRNSLVFEFTRLVAEIQPKAFCMENVPGMATMVTPEGLNVVDALCMDLDNRGYGSFKALRKGLGASAGIGAASSGRSRPTKHSAGVDDLVDDEPEQLAMEVR